MIQNYTKKPVTIQALKYERGGSEKTEELFRFVPGHLIDFKDGELRLKSMLVTIGDYIIKSINGEFYSCKPDIFEMTYTEEKNSGRSYSWALDMLKAGNRVCRKGWNGKGMWLALIHTDKDNNVLMGNWKFLMPMTEGTEEVYLFPWIGIKTADHCFGPWLCSQTDALAEDWELVE